MVIQDILRKDNFIRTHRSPNTKANLLVWYLKESLAQTLNLMKVFGVFKHGNVEIFAVFVGIFATTKINFDCQSQNFSHSHEKHIVVLEKTKNANTEVSLPD